MSDDIIAKIMPHNDTPNDRRTPFLRILYTLAQTYLVAWAWLAVYTGFLQSFWWHMLNPRVLGVSLFGISAMLGVTTCFPVILEFQFLLRKSIPFFWVFLGPLPAFFILIALAGDANLRTSMFAFAAVSNIYGQACVLASPADSPISLRFTTTTVAGILLLQALRVFSYSATVFIDYDFVVGKVVGCAIGVLCAAFIGLYEKGYEGSVSFLPNKTCCGSGRECKIWPLLAPCLAAASTLTFAFFNNAAAIGKYVGLDPFPSLVASMIGISAGWIFYQVLVGRVPDWGLYLVCSFSELVGVCVFGAGQSLVGGIILALALPLMWSLILQEMSRVARTLAVGRVYFLSGFLNFLHVFVFLAVLTGRHTPAIGLLFAGRSDAFLYFVVLPSCLAKPLLGALDWKEEKRAAKSHPASSAAKEDAKQAADGEDPKEEEGQPEEKEEETEKTVVPPLNLPNTDPEDPNQEQASINHDIFYAHQRPATGVQKIVVVMVVLLACLPAIIYRAYDVPPKCCRGHYGDGGLDIQDQEKVWGCYTCACRELKYEDEAATEMCKIGVADAPTNPDTLVVMAYNNQNGYDTDGYFNGRCFPKIVNKHKADFVAIAEGESMHFNTGNRDSVDYYNQQLHYHVDFGPPGHASFVGVAALSTRKFIAEPQYILLPKPQEGDLNRYMTVNRISVKGVEVVVAAVHLEWFGNPGIQTKKIAEYFKDSVDPVVVAGDFNLEPNGGNTDTPDAKGFDVLIDAGWKTATPFGCVSGLEDSSRKCPSKYTTAVVSGKDDPFPTIGYQLDWIIYLDGTNGHKLKLQANSVDVDLNEVRDGVYCSDHGAIFATFDIE